jgi:hypothetical protein
MNVEKPKLIKKVVTKAKNTSQNYPKMVNVINLKVQNSELFVSVMLCTKSCGFIIGLINIDVVIR